MAKRKYTESVVIPKSFLYLKRETNISLKFKEEFKKKAKRQRFLKLQNYNTNENIQSLIISKSILYLRLENNIFFWFKKNIKKRYLVLRCYLQKIPSTFCCALNSFLTPEYQLMESC